MQQRTSPVQQLQCHTRGIRSVGNVIPARIRRARSISGIHIVDRPRDVRPGEVLDERCGRVGRVHPRCPSSVRVLIKVDARSKDRECGVQDVDVLPMNVRHVAFGIKAGLEARGVQGIAGGDVVEGDVADVVGARQGDTVPALANHVGDVDVVCAVVDCNAVIAVEDVIVVEGEVWPCEAFSYYVPTPQYATDVPFTS